MCQNFIFKAEWYYVVWMYYILFIHSSIGGHLGYVYLLAIVSNAPVNTSVQMSLQDPAFSSGIAGLYGNLIAVWQFFEELPYCFP